MYICVYIYTYIYWAPGPGTRAGARKPSGARDPGQWPRDPGLM